MFQTIGHANKFKKCTFQMLGTMNICLKSKKTCVKLSEKQNL